jgi:hypothetical protein
MSDDYIAGITRERVKIIRFASHTIHIFQMLNVVLFRALKKSATSLTTLEEEQTIGALIIKVYHDFESTMIDVNIWEAFRVLGSTHDIYQIPYRLFFDEGKVRQSRGFIEFCGHMSSWRVYRGDGERPSSTELTSRNKSIWSISLAISIVGNEDMSPGKKRKSGLPGRLTVCLISL